MEDKQYNPSTYPLMETAITNRIMIKDPGKEMRDDFAGQAMMSLLTKYGIGLSYEETAQIAYEYADAMMKVRSK
jgi:hypothetical protein